MKSRDAGPKVNLVQKTMSVIEFMAGAKRGLPLKSISQGVGIPAATTHRIVASLMDTGYVEQSSEGEFYLTYKLLSVAGRVVERDGFLNRVLPILNYFTMTTECGMSVTTLTKDGVVSLAYVGGPRRFSSPLVSPGATVPLHCSAVGKLYLSELSDEELEEYISKTTLLPYTQKTITDPDRLREEIMETRANGYGVIRGEYTDNVGVLSIPLERVCGKTVNALNFSMVEGRFDEICNPAFIEKAKYIIRENFNKE